MTAATVTAFTLGHSVTLSIAALGFVRHPTGLVELAIAASLVALAIEIRSRASGVEPSPIGRWPWAIAFGFGLLHGLGFAGALQQIGLPGSDLLLALFAFNLGIEFGQVAFIAAVFASLALLRPLAWRAPSAVARVPVLASYAIGSMAFYWCFDRIAALM